jgi:hypothetical protein
MQENTEKDQYTSKAGAFQESDFVYTQSQTE